MNETASIDHYLHGKLSPEEHLLVEARLLLEPELKDKSVWQQQTYYLVKQYARHCMKREIEAVQHKLFSESRYEQFRKKISRIFGE